MRDLATKMRGGDHPSARESAGLFDLSRHRPAHPVLELQQILGNDSVRRLAENGSLQATLDYVQNGGIVGSSFLPTSETDTETISTPTEAVTTPAIEETFPPAFTESLALATPAFEEEEPLVEAITPELEKTEPEAILFPELVETPEPEQEIVTPEVPPAPEVSLAPPPSVETPSAVAHAVAAHAAEIPAAVETIGGGPEAAGAALPTVTPAEAGVEVPIATGAAVAPSGGATVPPTAAGAGAAAAVPTAVPPAPPVERETGAFTAGTAGPAIGATAPVRTTGPIAGVAGGADILMPEPPSELSEATRARIARVEHNAGAAARTVSTLPSAGETVASARGAVEEPSEETAARAGGALVEALGARPEPSPEIEELCERIYQVIRSKRPPDEESLVEANPEEMAQQAGGELNESIEGDATRVGGEYSELSETPEGEPALHPEEMETPPETVATPEIGAAAATPDAIPEENVSLDADVAASEARIEEAGMNTEPALLVESGPIAEAREASGELRETAEEDPAEVLARQRETLAAANNDMQALQQAALDALQSSRASTVRNAAGGQRTMVGSEERTRASVGTEAQRIFDDAQRQVNALIDPMPRTAMNKWNEGVGLLSTEFRQKLNRVAEWIEERHSGVGGFFLGIGDYLTGLPDWVTEEYDAAELAFGDGVCNLIREISTEVNGIVASCEAIIENARQQIDDLFASLPDDLREWAAGERARFSGLFDGLHNRVAEARDNFNRELVSNASQAVQDVRQEVHALREAARGLIGRIADAINQFLEDPAKFIINGLLQLVGISPASFWALVNKISQVIDDIADDPMNFINNLMSALSQGFTQFFDNFATHLINGFFNWLFSGLGSVGVQIPSDFSLKSIITFCLQLMGITWPRIRALLARHIGEENVALIERAYEIIANLIEMGPEGIFEMIKEQLNPQNILDQIIQAAIDFMIEALIRQVTIRVIAMFNPAGAIFQAIELIYRILKWIFENAARIFSFVETIVNGIADIIAGNIGGMANAVERALASLIPPVIDFLAGFLGLGDLPEKIADTIRRFQTWVESILDRVIGWLAEQGRRLLRALGIGEEEEEAPSGNAAIAAEAKSELQRVEGEAKNYDELRAEKETQARQIEETYTSRLEPGHTITIEFKEPTADEEDRDIDFDVTVASDPTTATGSIPVGDEDLELTQLEFGTRLFADQELVQFGMESVTAQRNIQDWTDAGILHELEPRGSRDPHTTISLYSFDSTKANRSTYSSRREYYGYDNPAKDSYKGLVILSKGLINAPPPGTPILDPDFHRNEARYHSKRSGTELDFDDAILGHDSAMGASQHWNAIGHMQTREGNLAWNQDTANYWGPETRAESAASGSSEPYYRIPAKFFESHENWW